MGKKKDALGLKFVKLAMEFHQLRPWNSVEADAPVLLHDSQGVMGLACVAGQSGQEPGLGVYFGEHALFDLEQLLTGLGTGMPVHSEYLVLTYAAWGQVSEAMQGQLQAWGFTARKESAAPELMVVQPGGLVRMANRGHLRSMIDTLQLMNQAYREGKLQPQELGAERKVLELWLEGKGRSSQVGERITTLAEPPEELGQDLEDEWGEVSWLDDENMAAWLESVKELPSGPETWVVAQLRGDDPDFASCIVLSGLGEEARVLTFQPIDLSQPEDLVHVLASVMEDGPSGDAETWESHRPRKIELVPTVLEIEDATIESLRQLDIEVEVSDSGAARETLEEFLNRLFEAAQGAHGEVQAEGTEGLGLARWNEIEYELSDLLVDELHPEKWIRGRGPARYFGSNEAADRLLVKLEEWEQLPCLVDWACMDYRAQARSRTLAEKLLAGKRLTPPQRALLEARCQAIVSVFRVCDTEPGASLEVENLLDGSRHTVMDHVLSSSVEAGEFIALRLFTIDGWTLAAPLTSTIPPFSANRVLDWVRDGVGEPPREGSIDHGRERFGLWWTMLEKDSQPTLQNTDGDLLVMLRARFRVADPKALVGHFDSNVELKRDGDELCWTWLRPGAGKGPAGDPGSRLVYARLELIDNELLADVTSSERLEGVRSELARIRGVTFEEAFEIAFPAHGDRLPSPPTDGDPGAVALLQEQIGRVIASDFDKPLPAFEGRTPREAYRDPKWRPRVEEWLRSMPDAISDLGPIAPPREKLLAILRDEGR